MTALVSLSAGGAISGFSFVPTAAADFSSPTSMPLNLVALQHSVQSPQADRPAAAHDAMLRAAVVHVAEYYLRMARSKSPAQMEAIIWQQDSIDGTDHGESCAAFASLTLELGAQVVGRESWVTGGGSYPWPLHPWADVRVEPNPASLGITSIQQDAQAHERWHPLGDGYRPLPGDWVLFDGHVEVVTKDAGGVLHTVGGDSLPDFSVNAHEYPGPLSGAGVVGFVNNGSLSDASKPAEAQPARAQAAGADVPVQGNGHAASLSSGGGSVRSGGGAEGAEHEARHRSRGGDDASASSGELAAIPGAATGSAARAATDPAIPGLVPAPRTGAAQSGNGARAGKGAQDGQAARPGQVARDGKRAHEQRVSRETIAERGSAAIPGLDSAANAPSGGHGAAYRRHHPSPARNPLSETRAQQAFISEVTPGALAAQHRYGVPAAVTIAQAIDESGWGQSGLAAQDHNLFGIKGTGPAGSVPLPTQEYVNGQPVSTSASFRVYHDVAESIDDHGRLLAESGYYHQAMADRHQPDKFAAALTGVYATDPNYGANLISLMRRYDLYRYGDSDQGQQAHGRAAPEAGSATIPGFPVAGAAPGDAPGSGSTPSAGPRPTPAKSPPPTETQSPPPTKTQSPQPTKTQSPQPTKTQSPQPTATASPRPTATASPRPTETGRPRPTSSGGPPPTPTDSPPPASTGSLQPSAPGSAGPSPTSQPTRAPSQPPTSTGHPQPAPKPTASSAASAAAAAPSPSAAIPGIGGASPQAESARRLAPAPTPRAPAASRNATSAPTRDAASAPASDTAAAPRVTSAASHSARASRFAAAPKPAAASAPAPIRATLVSAHRYPAHMPRSVLNSFLETAKGPLLAGETTYRDVASFRGISWQLLAACDWMQCDARPRRSPVYGERLGSVNADGTVYTHRSAALGRCADDLVQLARTVYGIDLTRADLSVRDLANAFAAFRWGGLLKAHDCSALEFPYSVAGLSDHHLGMRWPRITAPGTGDRPGSRFRRPFGAVPIVLGLDYAATV